MERLRGFANYLGWLSLFLLIMVGIPIAAGLIVSLITGDSVEVFNCERMPC